MQYVLAWNTRASDVIVTAKELLHLLELYSSRFRSAVAVFLEATLVLLLYGFVQTVRTAQVAHLQIVTTVLFEGGLR